MKNIVLQATLLTVTLLFSLTGIPPTVGFFAKLYVLLASVDAGLGWLAVVIALNPDHVPIARPRSASLKVALMIARLPGTSSAAPIPCTARPITSIRGDVAIPQSTDDAVKITTPTRKMRLRPS